MTPEQRRQADYIRSQVYMETGTNPYSVIQNAETQLNNHYRQKAIRFFQRTHGRALLGSESIDSQNINLYDDNGQPVVDANGNPVHMNAGQWINHMVQAEMNNVRHHVLRDSWSLVAGRNVTEQETKEMSDIMKSGATSSINNVMNEVMSGNLNFVGAIKNAVSGLVSNVIMAVPGVAQKVRQTTLFLLSKFTQKSFTWEEAGRVSTAQMTASRITSALGQGAVNGSALANGLSLAAMAAPGTVPEMPERARDAIENQSWSGYAPVVLSQIPGLQQGAAPPIGAPGPSSSGGAQIQGQLTPAVTSQLGAVAASADVINHMNSDPTQRHALIATQSGGAPAAVLGHFVDIGSGERFVVDSIVHMRGGTATTTSLAHLPDAQRQIEFFAVPGVPNAWNHNSQGTVNQWVAAAGNASAPPANPALAATRDQQMMQALAGINGHGTQDQAQAQATLNELQNQWLLRLQELGVTAPAAAQIANQIKEYYNTANRDPNGGADAARAIMSRNLNGPGTQTVGAALGANASAIENILSRMHRGVAEELNPRIGGPGTRISQVIQPGFDSLGGMRAQFTPPGQALPDLPALPSFS